MLSTIMSKITRALFNHSWRPIICAMDYPGQAMVWNRDHIDGIQVGTFHVERLFILLGDIMENGYTWKPMKSYNIAVSRDAKEYKKCRIKIGFVEACGVDYMILKTDDGLKYAMRTEQLYSHAVQVGHVVRFVLYDLNTQKHLLLKARKEGYYVSVSVEELHDI